jgi:hypothetical protein
LAQVLHRIWSQFKNILNASFVEADRQIFIKVKSAISLDLINFCDFCKFATRAKMFLKKSREGAEDLKFTRQLFPTFLNFSISVVNQFHFNRQSQHATHKIFPLRLRCSLMSRELSEKDETSKFFSLNGYEKQMSERGG